MGVNIMNEVSYVGAGRGHEGVGLFGAEQLHILRPGDRSERVHLGSCRPLMG